MRAWFATVWMTAVWMTVAASGVAYAQETPANAIAGDDQRPVDSVRTEALLREPGGTVKHVRYLDALWNAEKLHVADPNPRRLAEAYLRQNSGALSLPEAWLTLDDFVPAGLSDAPTKLQFIEAKSLGDAVVVSYIQTRLGLPIWQSAISVTIVNTHKPYIVSVTSSVSRNLNLQRPAGDFQFPAKQPTAAELARVLGIPMGQLRINKSRLIIYQYRQKQRTLPRPPGNEALPGAVDLVPSLPLPPLAETITEDEYRVANDVLFTSAVEGMGDVNWRVFIDLRTGSVLYLRSGVAFATGRIFPSDPITATGNSIMTPSIGISDLNLLRSPLLSLQGLAPPVADIQQLTSRSNTYVNIEERCRPVVPITEKPSPFEFDDSVESDGFAAVSAYYHGDAAFRLLFSLGIDSRVLFSGTIFPLPLDHRGIGDRPNATTIGNTSFNGVESIYFGRAAPTSAIGISADWRIVLHEFCHAILWNSIHTGTLEFAESGGDSLAAILSDPHSKAPRHLTFPWLPTFADRQHTRAVIDGWAWGGSLDEGYINYQSEQILSTTLFRMYQVLGGDDPDVHIKSRGSRYAANLIIRGLGLLNPYSPVDHPELLESAMIAADQSTAAIDGTPGGAVHKVIRWAFAKQGLHRPSGAPPNTEGAPPAVDVYINDGRDGDYWPYLADSTKAPDIWNRVCADGGSCHQAPVRFQQNYLYVRVKNRGTELAKDLAVRTYHRAPGTALTWPLGMQATTTAVLPAAGDPLLSISPGDHTIVGPFAWYPTENVDQLLATVSAAGDMSNIDPSSPLPANVGPIELSRLVPFDNNIAQREVYPVCLVASRHLTHSPAGRKMRPKHLRMRAR